MTKTYYLITISYCNGLLGTTKRLESIEEVNTFIEAYKKDREYNKFYKITKISGLFRKAEVVEVWYEE